MSLRKTLFWIHLGTGLLAGIAIALMSLTGAALAFEKELVAWVERDVRRVAVPADASARLSVDELRKGLLARHPELKQVSVTLRHAPDAAVIFTAGREGTYYANPYTGEIRQPATRRMHAFMEVMTDWHRWLALKEPQRATGKVINGVANLVFLALCITGIALWWPRNWTRRGVKAVAMVNLRLKGRARDWNWHNALGLWTLPILVVVTATAVPISFRWGSNLVFRMAGEAPPTQAGPGGMATPPPPMPAPEPGAQPLPLDTVLERAAQAVPDWQEISVRSNSGRRGGPETKGPQPLNVSIRQADPWPRTATLTLAVNPFTGEILSRTGWSDLSAGRRLRTWTRFLHTGEALGWWGQLLAGVACLGALVLVYTGFALSWRRFFRGKQVQA